MIGLVGLARGPSPLAGARTPTDSFELGGTALGSILVIGGGRLVAAGRRRPHVGHGPSDSTPAG